MVSLLTPIKAIIHRFKFLFIAMIAITMLGSSMMIGLTGAYTSLHQAHTTYVQDYYYPDLTINLKDNESVNIENIKQIEGVDKVSKRLVVQTNIEHGNDKLLVSKNFLMMEDDFQKFYYYDQDQSIDGVYVEKDFADSNNIKVGEEIKFNTQLGSANFKVSSIVTSVECLNRNQDNIAFGANKNFGYIFIPETVWKTIPGIQLLPFNQYLILCKDNYNNNEVLANVKEQIGEDKISSSFTYEESGVKTRIDINLQPLGAMTKFLPLCFYLASLLILGLFMGQIIRQYRKEFGILSSIGYTKSQLITIMLLLSLVITLSASIISLGVGMILCNITFTLFAEAIIIPVNACAISPLFCLLASLISIGIGLISSLISGLLILHITPREAMSSAPQIDSAPKGSPKFVTKLSPLAKVTFLSTWRNKTRFIVSSLGLIASLALIVSAVSFHYSKEELINQLFNVRFNNDCQIVLTEVPDDETLSQVQGFEGVEKVEKYSYFKGLIEYQGQSQEISVNGVCDNFELLNIPTTSNSNYDQVDGFILEKHIAEQMNISIGDTVLLNSIPTVVKGLSNQYMFRISYLPYQESLTYAKCNGIILADFSSDVGLINHVNSLKGYTSISFTSQTYEASAKEFAVYDIGVYIAILFAVVMGFIIVLNMEQTNLIEHSKNLGILRLIGVKTSQISRTWYAQLIIQLTTACVFGLPLGGLIAKGVLGAMSTKSREYVYLWRYEPFVLTFVVILAFSTISHLICMRQVSKWTLNEKTRL